MLRQLLRCARPVAPICCALFSASTAAAHTSLNAPNGGEVFAVGETATIEWVVAIPHDTQNWDLYYSTTGESGPWLPIALDLPPGSQVPGAPHQYDWTVPDTPSTSVRVRVVMDNSGMDYEDQSDADFTIQAACPSPASYCVTAPNSSGAGVLIGHAGSTSVAANDLLLTVTGASSDQPGVFFYGPSQIQVPFGDGFRCVGAGALGTFRLPPPTSSDAAGAAQRALDETLPPADAGPGQIAAGDTWNFQYWYRDPLAGGAGFNLSDAPSVGFCP